MTGFIGTSLQLQSIITAHTLNPFWTTSVWRMPPEEFLAAAWISGWFLLQVESYVTTDGASTSLSWNKAPIWDLRPDLYYCQTVAGLLMSCALSDERTSLPGIVVAGPRQRSHSRIRVLGTRDRILLSQNSRLPFSAPPTTYRFTVEVFDPSFTHKSTYNSTRPE
jgi:hypothetical protein